MPSNYTPNYKLNQWARTDQVLMDDFNADNAKIDSAIRAVDAKADRKADVSALEGEIAARTAADETLNATLSSHAQTMTKLGNCQIYSSHYTGNSGTQTLTFPERPAIVILVQSGGSIALCVYGAGQSRSIGNSDASSFWIRWSGNSLSWTGYEMNANNGSYSAFALCSKT